MWAPGPVAGEDEHLEIPIGQWMVATYPNYQSTAEIRAAIDRRYPLENAAEAHAYVDGGRRKGSVVLTMEGQEPKRPITEIL